jgi:hypothetical protein
MDRGRVFVHRRPGGRLGLLLDVLREVGPTAGNYR